MRKNKLTALIILLVILSIGACEYKPEGSFTRIVNPENETPDLSVDFNLDQDTNYLLWSTELEVNWEIRNKELLGFKLYIDDKEVHIGSYSDHDFDITLEKDLVDGFSENGLYHLKFELYTNSGTGSIADLAGGEGYIYTVQRYLFMTDEVEKPHFLSVQKKDGSLELEWKKFKGIYFYSYDVIKQKVNPVVSKGFYYASIDDRETTSMFDKAYVGEPVRFYVQTRFRGGHFSTDTIELSNSIPQIQSETLNDENSIKYSWNKTAYYNNFGGYRLSIDDTDGPPYTYQELITLTDVADTVYSLYHPKIGVDIAMLLTVVPKYENPFFEDLWTRNKLFSTTVTNRLGSEFPEYNIIYTPIGHTEYFKRWGEPKINTFNTKNQTFGTIASSYNYSDFAVSSNAKYLISTTSMPSVEIRNLQTNTHELIPFEQLDCESKPSSVSISDNKIAVLNPINGLKIWDLENMTQVAETQISYYGPLVISPDGSFLIRQENLGEIVDGTVNWVLDGQFQNQDILHLEFIPDASRKVVICTHNNVNIVNCETLETESSFPVDIQRIMNIDFNRSALLFHTSDDYLKILDLNNGQITWEWPVYKFADRHHLFHDFITSEDGNILKIN